ncbi:MAG: phage baseplate assembly protein V [Gallionella sp.]|jgi:phage baseplate assembly protein V
MMRTISKMIAPVSRRLRLTVSRAVITLVNDSLKTQRMQLSLLDGEVMDGVERFQEYGFSSVPLPGCQAVMVCIGGSRSHGIVAATEDGRHRVKGLLPGETVIYDDLGQKVYLSRNGIVIDGAGLPLNIINVPQTNLSGNLHVAGSIVADADISDHGNKSMAGMRTVYNGHTHTDPQGGSVSEPGAQM